MDDPRSHLSQAERRTGEARQRCREVKVHSTDTQTTYVTRLKELNSLQARARLGIRLDLKAELVLAQAAYDQARTTWLRANRLLFDAEQLVTMMQTAEDEAAQQYMQFLDEKLQQARESRQQNDQPSTHSNKQQPNSHNTRQRAGAAEAEKAKDSFASWRKEVDVAFSNYAALQRFPAPPAKPCSDSECETCADIYRSLQVCDCNIREIFAGFDKAALKMERWRWHPLRFAVCPEEHRKKFRKMARR